MTAAESNSILLLGATGDLAAKKLFPALYSIQEQGLLPGPVVGVGRRDIGTTGLRERAEASVRAAFDRIDDKHLTALLERVVYVSGDYTDPGTWQAIGAALGTATTPLAFLAIRPEAFEDVVTAIGEQRLAGGGVIVEKPFGRDLASAKELNRVLHEHYAEDSIFRIDHFLGKEPVQNMLVVRFANAIVEPLLNRHHVQSVQITMAEDFGVETRGSFYDSVGTIRDVVQNHLLQLMCLLAMDPPVSSAADALRDEVARVLEATRTVRCEDVVFGQYAGYRDVDGVAAGSTTETFVALELAVENWRWAGVPFYIRAGKALERTVTEAVVEFKRAPRPLFADGFETHPNHLRFCVKPDDVVSLHLQAKLPGDELVGRGVELEVSAQGAFGDGPQAYERLIRDALEGDARLFARQDAVEQAWRIFDDVLASPPEPALYERGSIGPAEARPLIGHLDD